MTRKHFRRTNSSPDRLPPGAVSVAVRAPFVSFLDKVLAWGLGLLCLFISISFYTGTYDTAFVKITLLQTGGICLTALWLTLLAVQQRFPITRQNLPWLLPFLVYFGWNFLTYLLAPYKLEGFDEFLRYVLYASISLIILDRFTKEHIRILIKCIVLAAWISCLYGFVQVLDHWIPGADIMPWRGFFGTRIFSTHANPNFFADFVVFSSFLVLAEYIRTRQKRLLALLFIQAIDLFFSESKGAWVGFAAAAAASVIIYTNCSTRLRKYTRTINTAVGILLLGAGILVSVYAAKRFQSVSFRTYTWAATVSMIQDSPVMGTGLGSFKTIYPAYRKPQIFYIEKIHNNETQHPENEYLEQWATGGTIGLAVFLWFLFFALYAGWRGIKDNQENWTTRHWQTLACMAALFSIAVHSTFDISVRFVSTGLFFAVFAALIIRLQLPGTPAEKPLPRPGPVLFLWIARLLLAAETAWVGYYFISLFAQTTSNVGANGIGGYAVQAAGWISVCGLTAAGMFAYIYTAGISRWVRVPVILLLSLWPLQFVYGFFLSDHYYGIAAEFSRRNLADGALDFYHKAIEYNPFVSAYHQYRSYVLRNTLQLQRSYSPVKGDPVPVAGQPLWNDYERALRDLAFVEKHSPNNSLLHQAYGELYYMTAVLYTRLSQETSLPYQRQEYEQKAIENMELAKQRFQRSLLIDPVNESTYIYLTSIAMMERNPAQAQAWIDTYRRGPAAVTEEEFLKTHRQSIRLAQMEQQLRQAPFYYYPMHHSSTVETYDTEIL